MLLVTLNSVLAGVAVNGPELLKDTGDPLVRLNNTSAAAAPGPLASISPPFWTPDQAGFPLPGLKVAVRFLFASAALILLNSAVIVGMISPFLKKFLSFDWPLTAGRLSV